MENDIVSVLYEGEKLFSLTGGQSGTLLCSEKKMNSDVVIEAKALPEIEFYDGDVEVF